MNCPYHHKLREGLEPPTDRIAQLPVDERGYPVPYFVAWIDGKPDFRLTDPAKFADCMLHGNCWVCGTRLGAHLAFPIGPMCAINRTTSEPPSHRNCAEWSIRNCPFLTRPNMVRREDEVTEANKANTAGIPLYRNPGVTCLWMTKFYAPFLAPNGVLFQVGDPEEVTWWREGRPATREEILESIHSGLPSLRELCDQEDTDARKMMANRELDQRYEYVLTLLPV